MWKEVKLALNWKEAEMWKDIFEGKGIPTKILPADGSYRICIPSDQAHLVEHTVNEQSFPTQAETEE
jgi:hypothetical protein